MHVSFFQISVGELCLFFGVFGYTDVEGFTLPDNIDECLKSFFKWSFGVVTMGIENIDILQIHAF